MIHEASLSEDDVVDMLTRFKSEHDTTVLSKLFKVSKDHRFDHLLKPPTKGTVYRGMGSFSGKAIQTLGAKAEHGLHKVNKIIKRTGVSWTLDPLVACEYAAEASYGTGTWAVVLVADLSANSDAFIGNPYEIDKVTGYETTLPELEIISTGKPIRIKDVASVKDVDDFSKLRDGLATLLKNMNEAKIAASASYLEKEKVRERLQDEVIQSVSTGKIKSQDDLEDFFKTCNMALRALQAVPFDVYAKLASR